MYPRAQVSAQRIAEVLDTKPSIKDGKVNSDETDKKGEIEFKNVSFKYPDGDDYVLKNISFTAHQGETVAIIGSTGSGKTTMLRDIVRQLSYKSYRVSVVDERSEIAALCEGRSAFDLGFSTDVLEGVDKAEGMLMVLRSMSPDVIVTDEIGKQSDIDAIERITNSGAAVIATIHGRNIDMIKRRDDLKRMLKFFDLIITLSRRKGIGTVEEALTEW